MMTTFKKIPILLVLFVAFIASDAFSQDKPSNEIFFETQNIDVWNDCAGETLIGDVLVKIIFHYNKDGDLKAAQFVPLSGVLIGQISGDVYQATGNGGGGFNIMNANSGAYTSHNRNLLHFVGPGSQVRIIFKVHTTINANGEVTVDFDHSYEDCK